MKKKVLDCDNEINDPFMQQVINVFFRLWRVRPKGKDIVIDTRHYGAYNFPHSHNCFDFYCERRASGSKLALNFEFSSV